MSDFFIVIAIDAIIGAGKTTLIEQCLIPILTRRGLRITYIREPINSERLKDFYLNPSRRAYQFQTKMFHDRVKECQRQHRKYHHCTDVFLMERSIFSDLLFMKTLYDEGNLDKTEYDDYMELWTMWEDVMPFKPDLFVYLNPEVDVAMKRLKERSREGEEGVEKDYQMLLKKHHDDFLGGEYVSVSGSHHVPCLHIDTNSNFRDDQHVKEKLADKLEGYIELIRNSKERYKS